MPSSKKKSGPGRKSGRKSSPGKGHGHKGRHRSERHRPGRKRSSSRERHDRERHEQERHEQERQERERREQERYEREQRDRERREQRRRPERVRSRSERRPKREERDERRYGQSKGRTDDRGHHEQRRSSDRPSRKREPRGSRREGQSQIDQIQVVQPEPLPGPSQPPMTPKSTETAFQQESETIIFGRVPGVKIPSFVVLKNLPDHKPGKKKPTKPPKKVERLPFRQTGMYRRYAPGILTPEEWDIRREYLDLSKEECSQPQPVPSVRYPKWRRCTDPGYDTNNPAMHIKTEKDRKNDQEAVFQKFKKLYPLHPSRKHMAQVHEEALNKLSRAYPTSHLYEKDYDRIAVVHSLEEFHAEDSRIGLIEDIKRHNFMALDAEDHQVLRDCRERMEHPETGVKVCEPDHRFYFRKSYYFMISSLSGKMMIIHTPSLYGKDWDEVIKTYKPIKYLLDYLPVEIRQLLEDHRIVKSGSAIIEQEYGNRLKRPGFVPMATACTRRIFHFWHSMRWSPGYQPQPGRKTLPSMELKEKDQGYGLDPAMRCMLDYSLPPRPLPLADKHKIYWWEINGNEADDYFKRHTYPTHYIYIHADTTGPAALSLVLLLKILSMPRDQIYAGNVIQFEEGLSLGHSIYKLLSQFFRCMPNQGEEVAKILNERYKAKKKSDPVTGPSSSTTQAEVHQSAGAAPKTKGSTYPGLTVENEPLDLKRITFEEGVEVIQTNQRGGVRFRYKRNFVLQEATQIDPELPKGCSLCNGDHRPINCKIAASWKRSRFRALEQGKMSIKNVPSTFLLCDYPYCEDPRDHTRATCPYMHHRCQECDHRGHKESRCKYLINPQKNFGIFRSYATSGVLTQHGIPEPKAVTASKAEQDPERAPPRLHVLEAGYYNPPPELRGDLIRGKIYIFDEELKYMHPKKHIPIVYDKPALARIADEKDRIAAIKSFPHYVMKTRNEQRTESRERLDFEPAPAEIDRVYVERDQYQTELETAKKEIQRLQLENDQLKNTLKDNNINIPEPPTVQEPSEKPAEEEEMDLQQEIDELLQDEPPNPYAGLGPPQSESDEDLLLLAEEGEIFRPDDLGSDSDFDLGDEDDDVDRRRWNM